MSILVSIDPGKWHCGVAVWHGDRLNDAFLLIQKKTEPWLNFTERLASTNTSYIRTGKLCPGDRAVIEVPQVYPGSPVRHEDLIQLAASAGAIAGALRASGCAVEQARPGKWTRETTTNKEVRLERGWAKLTKEERARVRLPKVALRQEDVKDAICLGLWRLGRW